MIGVVPWRYKGGRAARVSGLHAALRFRVDESGQPYRRAYQAVPFASPRRIRRPPTRIAHFYDEYLAVMDLPAEFYLETVQRIFMEHELAKGELTYKGRKVRPETIKKTFLFTVEGERDDICGLGQTAAALDLCTGLRPLLKRHHVQTGVGHYGVFSGKRWAGEIYPRVREVIEFSV